MADSRSKRPSASQAALVVEDLRCTLDTPDGEVSLVDGVSFELARGQSLGVVGESGSGKTMLVRSIMGIGPRAARTTGRVILDGSDLLSLPPRERHRRLGRSIGMIFQNATTSLNPVLTIGRQVIEGLRFHQGLSRSEARDRAIQLLTDVGISDPKSRLRQFPHQLSGGMQQRVAIASALGCGPELLIADEATTALDVTVQHQILDLLEDLQERHHLSLIIISHDLGVVATRTQKIGVMYAGQMVELSTTERVFEHPRHRYTEALLAAVPSFDGSNHRRMGTIEGLPPRLDALPPGCRFARRCAHAEDDCHGAPPPIQPTPDGEHWYRCIHPAAPPEQPDTGDSTTAFGDVHGRLVSRAERT